MSSGWNDKLAAEDLVPLLEFLPIWIQKPRQKKELVSLAAYTPFSALITKRTGCSVAEIVAWQFELHLCAQCSQWSTAKCDFYHLNVAISLFKLIEVEIRRYSRVTDFMALVTEAIYTHPIMQEICLLH